MSYDVAIWKSTGPLSARDAQRVYQDLPGGNALVATRAMAKFHRALVAQHPELDDSDDDVCPWSAELEVTDRYVVAPMVFSRADDVLADILALARKHDLDVFDPQTGKLVTPDMPRPARRRKPSPAPAAVRFAEVLGKSLARHGFAVAPPLSSISELPTFVRVDGRATQELFFRWMTSRYVEACVRIRLAEVSAILDPYTAGWDRWEDGVVSGCLHKLYHAVTGSWSPSLIGDHDVSPAGLSTALRAIPRQFTRYTLPVFDGLRTLKRVDRILHARPFEPRYDVQPDWLELAFVGTVVAKLAGRSDYPQWLLTYRRLVARRDPHPRPLQRQARAAYRKLVLALGS